MLDEEQRLEHEHREEGGADGGDELPEVEVAALAEHAVEQAPGGPREPARQREIQHDESGEAAHGEPGAVLVGSGRGREIGRHGCRARRVDVIHPELPRYIGLSLREPCSLSEGICHANANSDTVLGAAGIDLGPAGRQHCRALSETHPLSSVLACPRCRRGPVHAGARRLDVRRLQQRLSGHRRDSLAVPRAAPGAGGMARPPGSAHPAPGVRSRGDAREPRRMARSMRARAGGSSTSRARTKIRSSACASSSRHSGSSRPASPRPRTGAWARACPPSRG